MLLDANFLCFSSFSMFYSILFICLLVMDKILFCLVTIKRRIRKFSNLMFAVWATICK